MGETPRLTFTTVNIGAPDPSALGRFYSRLLSWPLTVDEPGWVIMRDPGGGVGLSFQEETEYVRPIWPARRDAQQMMLHLEILVDDLTSAVVHAEQCGATVADFQPQEHVRVMLDPAGHPFCLWVAN